MEEEKVIINKIRAFYYMSGVLKNQEGDPRCSVCKSRKETAEELQELFNEFKKGLSASEVPEQFQSKVEKIEETLNELKLPANPIPQRKVGGCHFPDKECIVKESFDIFEDAIEEEKD